MLDPDCPVAYHARTGSPWAVEDDCTQAGHFDERYLMAWNSVNYLGLADRFDPVGRYKPQMVELVGSYSDSWP